MTIREEVIEIGNYETYRVSSRFSEDCESWERTLFVPAGCRKSLWRVWKQFKDRFGAHYSSPGCAYADQPYFYCVRNRSGKVAGVILHASGGIDI